MSDFEADAESHTLNTESSLPSGTPDYVFDDSQIDPSSTSADLQPSKKRKSTSNIWEYFDRDKRVNGRVPCRTCSKTFASKEDNSSGTRHLWGHLEHCTGLSGLQPRQQQLTFGARLDTKAATEALLTWIAADQHAFLAVEHPKFLAFCKSLAPEYIPPKADALKNRLMNRYSDLKDKVQAILAAIDSRLALTTDAWSAPNGDHFLALTGHWIDKQWKHRSCMLAFLEFPSPHSAEHGFDLIWEVLQQFDIETKIGACVTDNAPSAYNISTRLEAALPHEPFHPVRCSAHLLQLAVRHGLTDSRANEAIEPARAFANKVRRSSPLSSKLEAMCRRLGDKYTRPLRDMEVRWNSTLNMVKALIPMETAIARLCRDDPDFKVVALPSSVWQHLRDVVSVLEPFAEATVHLQGLIFPTLSAVAQIIDLLVHDTAANETNAELSDLGRRLATHLNAQLQNYLDTLLQGKAAQFAALLDPSIKLALAAQASDPLTLRSELKTFLEEYYQTPPAQESAATPTPSATSFLDRLNQRRGLISHGEQTPSQQVDQYLNAGLSSASISPTLFWQSQVATLPNLARLTKDILAIPASTAASESAFSRGKLLISDRRNLLSPSTVSKMMCIDNWQSALGDLLE